MGLGTTPALKHRILRKTGSSARYTHRNERVQRFLLLLLPSSSPDVCLLQKRDEATSVEEWIPAHLIRHPSQPCTKLPEVGKSFLSYASAATDHMAMARFYR